MRIIPSILLLILSPWALAQKAHVIILDPNIDSKELEKNFHVHRGSTHVSSIPDRKLRNSFLSDVDKVQKWDELKKDIFFIDLKNKDLSTLKKKYPEFSKTELKSLKDIR